LNGCVNITAYIFEAATKITKINNKTCIFYEMSMNVLAKVFGKPLVAAVSNHRDIYTKRVWVR
jgi:hypothetical protein